MDIVNQRTLLCGGCLVGVEMSQGHLWGTFVGGHSVKAPDQSYGQSATINSHDVKSSVNRLKLSSLPEASW